MLDLPVKVKARLIHILSGESKVEQAIVFGSRARGDAKANSDIDLALIGYEIPISLNTKLREAAGLYQMDIVKLNELGNDELADNIHKDGVVIYRSEGI